MSEGNLETIRGIFDRTALGDWDVADVFDPDVEFVLVGSEGLGLSAEGRGIDALMSALVGFIGEFRDYRVVAEEILELDDHRVFLLGRAHGFGRVSDVPFEHENGQVFTLQDRKVVRWELYWNRDLARQAVGLPR